MLLIWSILVDKFPQYGLDCVQSVKAIRSVWLRKETWTSVGDMQ